MTNDEVYVGTIGLEVIVHTNVDLTDLDIVGLSVLQPDGVATEWSAEKYVYTGDVVPKSLRYVTEDGDLDSYGTYSIQSFAGTDEGHLHYGKTTYLEVYDRFKP